jgi:hypothetical protein
MLDRGPATAYDLARSTTLARANTYQALYGLVEKGAAILIGENPKIFRPISPNAVLTLMAELEARRLDRLEAEVAELGKMGEPATVKFAGRRAFEAVVLRNAVRAEWIKCVAPPEILKTLTPIWRKREADEKPSELWVIGGSSDGSELEVGPSGSILPNDVIDIFGSKVALLLTPAVAIVARETEASELDGYWTSESLLVGMVRAAVALLTGA